MSSAQAASAAKAAEQVSWLERAGAAIGPLTNALLLLVLLPEAFHAVSGVFGGFGGGGGGGGRGGTAGAGGMGQAGASGLPTMEDLIAAEAQRLRQQGVDIDKALMESMTNPQAPIRF